MLAAVLLALLWPGTAGMEPGSRVSASAGAMVCVSVALVLIVNACLLDGELGMLMSARCPGWNLVMAHFLAQTNVYCVREPLHFWVDITLQDSAAHSPSSVSAHGGAKAESSLQIAWLRVGDRARVRPGHVLPVDGGVVLQGLELKSQQITLRPSHLRAAHEWNEETGWRLLLVQAISDAGHVLAEDWLPVQLVERHMDAASKYGFKTPPMPQRSTAPILVHFVHLHLGKSHVEQLEAVSEGKKRSGSSASRGAAQSSDCSLLFEIAVKTASRLLSSSTVEESAELGGEILVHTNGLPDGPICRRIAAARHVRLLPIGAPSAIYGRRVLWHQHQADVIRMQALRRWGGVYLDTDALVLQPETIHALLRRRLAVIGEQEEGGICNGVILAPPSSPFIQRWAAQYVSFKDSEMGMHSSYFPMRLASEHPHDVIVLPPSRMHWPSFRAEGIKALWLANWWGAPKP